MRKTTKTLIIIACSFLPLLSVAQTASFITPDTVCITQPVNITNTSTGTTNYYWNFCVADLKTAPNGVNLGNVNGELSAPVFMDYVFTNGNYYGFLTNYNPGELIRLDFGNSLLNTPKAVNLGGFGGIIPAADGAEGIQIVNNEGKWYAIIVGGYTAAGYNPRILKIAFGADITNPSPIATSWGNIGGFLQQPIDLHVFKENDNWYGFTVNSQYNTITRFNFTNSFENMPTAENLGNLGNLAYPTGIYAVKNNTDWNVFIVNGGNNTMTSGTWSLTRLNFGSSLLNVPTAVNLGNPGGVLKHPRDLTIMKSCGQIVGFVVNGNPGYNNIVTLDFNNDLNSTPEGKTLDNIGQLDFPHSISKLFRVGDELYGFITNVRNNTITRLQFSGCNNSSLKSSSEKDPPPITFDKVGTYQINLTTDEGLPSQSSYCRQVTVIAPPVHTPLQTFTINPGEKIKIGTTNPSGAFKWNTGATTDSIVANSEGLYWVETTGYGCSNIDSFLVRYLITADFSYKQDACNPLLFEFKNAAPESTVLNWDFGNGPVEAGKPDPTITYNSLGNYNVTLNLKSAEGDLLSVTKQIAVQVLNDSLIINNNSSICDGKNLQLDAIPALSYCWTPATGLSATDIKNPVATPSTNTTYFLHSLVTGQNLITNGDFSNGNNSFLSDYQYSLKNTIPAQYFIGASPSAWNNQFNNCTDHSSGSANMMIVKSSSVKDKQVWSQTINVLPNTNYSFSTFVQSLSAANNIQLQLAINGNIIGSINESIPSCTWKEFYSTWNSGNKTSITLSIINQNTQTPTDFALDDIAFAEVFLKRDSVKINIEKASVQINNDSTVCWGATVQLKATGADSYSWTPTANVENPNTGITSAKIYQATKFFVTGTTKNGCTATDSINFFIHPKPLITKTADTLICPNSKIQLHINGGISYSWSPAASLDDPSIDSPTTAPDSDTKYFVDIMDNFACKYKDSILVSIKPFPDFSITPPTKICMGDSVRLFADGGDQYNWTPVTVMNDPTLHNPIVFPEGDTEFKVSIKESLCNISKELSTMVYVFSKPLITASKTNDIDCSFGTTHLTATGGTSYQWSGMALSNPNIYNPIAKPTTTTTYIVTAKDLNGCTNEDSVTVNVDYTNKGENYIYSAFTPNNDGLNDCFGISHWGDVENLEFSIYNRWGERVFFTTNSNICWDGKYKSVPQVAGMYVYQVKGKTACTNINLKGTFVLIR